MVTPSPVATVVDDVRYCGKSGLSADVEFLSEFDQKPKWRRDRLEATDTNVLD